MFIIMANALAQENPLAIMSCDDFGKILVDIFVKNFKIIEDPDGFF